MTLDEALFLVDRSGTNSKCRGDELKTNIKNGDKVLVQRDLDHFYYEYNGNWDNLRDDDLLLVWEDNQSKHVTGQTYKTLFEDADAYLMVKSFPPGEFEFTPRSGSSWNAWPGNISNFYMQNYNGKLIRNFAGTYTDAHLQVTDSNGTNWMHWTNLTIAGSNGNSAVFTRGADGWLGGAGNQWKENYDYYITITGVPGLS